jgi:hypothetical protein
LLNSSLACESSYVTVAPGDSTNVIVSGRPAVAGVAANAPVVFNMDEAGKVVRRFRDGGTYYTGYQVPESFRSGLEQPAFGMLINNSQLLAAALAGSGPGNAYRLLAFRKRDQSWHTVPIQGDRADPRGFGSFLAFQGAIRKSREFSKSVGAGEWSKKPSDRGPDLESVFQDSPFAYTGQLYLYDVNTETTYAIETKQADSEVLLVEDNIVYYRSSDRLYSVPITEKGLGTAKLLATDEAIRDAHWAFIKH